MKTFKTQNYYSLMTFILFHSFLHVLRRRAFEFKELQTRFAAATGFRMVLSWSATCSSIFWSLRNVRLRQALIVDVESFLFPSAPTFLKLELKAFISPFTIEVRKFFIPWSSLLTPIFPALFKRGLAALAARMNESPHPENYHLNFFKIHSNLPCIEVSHVKKCQLTCW